jgi:hypothetical protein
MARSTGPILAVGAVTLANQSLLAKNPQPIDFRIPVATAIAAGGLALLERLSEGLAVGIAYIALVAVLFARLDPKAGAPAENLLRIMGENK